MPDSNLLQAILNDPRSSSEEKEQAQRELDALTAPPTDAASESAEDPVTALESEMLKTAGARDLAGVEYQHVHRFCSTRRWDNNARELFERWRHTYFTTVEGRKDLERMASYLRKHDFEEWRVGADEWKNSGFKNTYRLLRALQVIVDSPRRGNYHDRDTVAGAAMFLEEIKRRTGSGA